jgi:hypothetical protein
MVVTILGTDRIEQQQNWAEPPTPTPSLMVNPRDNKTIRLVVIVVLALIVAYLLYSAS